MVGVRPALAPEIVGAELGFTKSFTVQNHSDARSLIGKWNQPEPTVNGTNQTVSVPSIPSGRHTPS